MAAMNHLDLPRAPWRKSSYSGNGNNCVEAATLDGRIAVRDTTEHTGVVLDFSAHAWEDFTSSLT